MYSTNSGLSNFPDLSFNNMVTSVAIRINTGVVISQSVGLSVSQISVVTSVIFARICGHKCRWSQVSVVTNVGSHKCRWSQMSLVTSVAEPYSEIYIKLKYCINIISNMRGRYL